MLAELAGAGTIAQVPPPIDRCNRDTEEVGEPLGAHHLWMLLRHEERVWQTLSYNDRLTVQFRRGMRSTFEERERHRGELGLLPWRDLGDGRAVLEFRLDQNWALEATFNLETPGVPLLELRIFPATLSPPPAGLTVDILRSVRMAPLHTEVRNLLKLPPGVGPVRDDDRNEHGRARRPGRRGQSDLFYAEWASRYVKALRTSTNPMPGLASDFDFDASTIRGFLTEARRRGLLTPAPPGRAGGKLTADALKLLAKSFEKRAISKED
jgi:hypothetical protein